MALKLKVQHRNYYYSLSIHITLSPSQCRATVSLKQGAYSVVIIRCIGKLKQRPAGPPADIKSLCWIIPPVGDENIWSRPNRISPCWCSTTWPSPGNPGSLPFKVGNTVQIPGRPMSNSCMAICRQCMLSTQLVLFASFGYTFFLQAKYST